MGRTWTRSWLPFLAGLSHRGLAATIPAVTVAPTSVITVTSTYSNTVTNTIISILPVTTVETTCTPSSVAAIGCTDLVWSKNGIFWQEWCSTASLEGSAYVTLVAPNPYACQQYCSVYSASCTGANWATNLDCVILKDITSTAEISTRSFAAIERFSTNPCVVTMTDSSTQLSTATRVMEYTATYTSTITLSTSASPSPTNDAISVSSLTTPTSTSTVTTPAASVLCSDTVQGYSGFLPNSRQDDIWGCIEVCSTYSNCIGTYWFLDICYSESGALDYSYVPYDYSDPDNNVVNYIAMRLDSNPCAICHSIYRNCVHNCYSVFISTVLDSINRLPNRIIKGFDIFFSPVDQNFPRPEHPVLHFVVLIRRFIFHCSHSFIFVAALFEFYYRSTGRFQSSVVLNN
ncbi:hypothetical protein BO78DRAFT_422308 [Aspergillus sclerotiicarbonarius CBS 121057]|uniref:Apple domain-containing protein n=1 Tax=Aspergillus sclerotiicarbonarius (strain CBS 121057 / IBT 28362) TaxID=1448318 RepID=A0A319FA06_ASPSB|nr:hypothetical protein BO78DRAFT_422308 [Aspergillus sclerotiicarbonarius CBS 121057]